MYDTKCAHFIPGPGLFEYCKVQDQPTAQKHFLEVREIRQKAPVAQIYPRLLTGEPKRAVYTGQPQFWASCCLISSHCLCFVIT